MKICLKFTSKQDRDEWLSDNGCMVVAKTPGGEPIRFAGERYTLSTPVNELLILTGEYQGNGPR